MLKSELINVGRIVHHDVSNSFVTNSNANCVTFGVQMQLAAADEDIVQYNTDILNIEMFTWVVKILGKSSVWLLLVSIFVRATYTVVEIR